MMDPFPLMDGHLLLAATLEAVHESSVVLDDHQRMTFPCDHYAEARSHHLQLLMAPGAVLETVCS
jgi:hypothetical protein